MSPLHIHYLHCLLDLHDHDIAKFPITQFKIKIYLEWIILRWITLHRYSAAIKMSWQWTAINCVHSLFNHIIHSWSAFKFCLLLYVEFLRAYARSLGTKHDQPSRSLTVNIRKKGSCLSHGLWSTTMFKHH